MRGSALGFTGKLGITSFFVHQESAFLGCSVWLYCVILTILREIDLQIPVMWANATTQPRFGGLEGDLTRHTHTTEAYATVD